MYSNKKKTYLLLFKKQYNWRITVIFAIIQDKERKNETFLGLRQTGFLFLDLFIF